MKTIFSKPIGAAAGPSPWPLTILAVLLIMLTTANPSTFGVFFKPMSEKFEWSRGAVSGALALRSLIAAIAVVPLGYLSDRYGPRWLLVPSFLVAGAGLALVSRVTTLPELYLTQGVILGIGTAAPWACISGTIGKWHDSHRALALALVASGTGLSSLVLSPVAAKLIQAAGWQAAMVWLAMLVGVVGAAGAAFMANPPGDRSPAPEKEKVQRRPGLKQLLHTWRVLPTFVVWRPFLPLFWMFFLLNTAAWIIMPHFVNYLTDAGIAPLLAASMFGAVGLGNTGGRLAMGILGRHVSARSDAVICFVLTGVSLLLLIFALRANWLVWVAAIGYGTGVGGSMSLATTLLADRFGTKHLSMLTAMVFVGIFTGAGIGPWIGGFLFDVTGRYTVAILAAVLFLSIAITLALSLRPTSQAIRDKVEQMIGQG